MLSSNYPTIFISRIIHDELKDMVAQGRTVTSIFRKLMFTLIPNEEIWAKVKAKSIRQTHAAEYGAAKGYKNYYNLF